MKRLRVEHPQAVGEAIRAMVEGQGEQLLLHKLHCVLLVGQGCTCHQVATWFGDTTRSVERWVSAFNDDGVVGLQWHGSHGRPPRLPHDFEQRLRCELRQTPAACGVGGPLWTGRLLEQHLAEHYGIRMSLRQCQRTLQRLGASRRSGATG